MNDLSFSQCNTLLSLRFSLNWAGWVGFLPEELEEQRVQDPETATQTSQSWDLRT